jgi:hypothetical protein
MLLRELNPEIGDQFVTKSENAVFEIVSEHGVTYGIKIIDARENFHMINQIVLISKNYTGDVELHKRHQKTPERNSMKITTNIRETPKKQVTYPCFKFLNDNPKYVVLFFNRTSGIGVEGFGKNLFETNRNPENYSEPLENYSATFSSEP